jgi:hypothetical protein
VQKDQLLQRLPKTNDNNFIEGVDFSTSFSLYHPVEKSEN